MTNKFISSIFAVDDNGTMGNNGSLPWGKIPEDMKYFSKVTQHCTLIMGRKTWESPDMLRPLPGRQHLVLTSRPEQMREKYETLLPHVAFTDNSDLLNIQKYIRHGIDDFGNFVRTFVIGGPDLINYLRPITKFAYISKIAGTYEGDVSIDLDSYLRNFDLLSARSLGKSATVSEYISR